MVSATNKEKPEYHHILLALDLEQHKDLAKHLYSAHLMHRRPALREKHLFPAGLWSEWPIPSNDWSHGNKRRKIREAGNFDHRVPIPRSVKEYTDVDEPRRSLLGLAAVETFPIEHVEPPEEFFAGRRVVQPEIEPDPYAERKLTRARKLLMFELKANFQHQIHQKISKDRSLRTKNRRLVPMVDPCPNMGVQSRVKVMDMINRVLDRLALERERYIHRTHENMSADWQYIIMNDVLVGDTMGRCARLFGSDPRNPGFKDWEPRNRDRHQSAVRRSKKRKVGVLPLVRGSDGNYDETQAGKLDPVSKFQYQMMNLMDNAEDTSLFSGGKNSGEAHRALSVGEPKPNTNELIDMMTVELDWYPTEFEHVEMGIDKAVKEAQEFQNRADTISKLDTLNYLDAGLYERAKKTKALVRMSSTSDNVLQDANFIYGNPALRLVETRDNGRPREADDVDTSLVDTEPVAENDEGYGGSSEDSEKSEDDLQIGSDGSEEHLENGNFSRDDSNVEGGEDGTADGTDGEDEVNDHENGNDQENENGNENE
jgi:hypothetical protein